MERLARQTMTQGVSSATRLSNALVSLLVLVTFALPLLCLIAVPIRDRGFSYGLHALNAALTSPAFALSIDATVQIAFEVSIATTMIALLAAWFLHKLNSKFWEGVLVLSLIVAYSTLTAIRATAILITLSPDRPLSTFVDLIFRNQIPLNSSTYGVVIGLVHFFLPMTTLYLYAGLKVVPVNLTRASEILSGSRFVTIRTVYWPAMRLRILYVLLATFLLSLGAYITPSILGGGSAQMISVVIDERTRSAGALEQALLYGLLFSIGFAAVGLAAISLSRRSLSFSDIRGVRP